MPLPCIESERLGLAERQCAISCRAVRLCRFVPPHCKVHSKFKSWHWVTKTHKKTTLTVRWSREKTLITASRRDIKSVLTCGVKLDKKELDSSTNLWKIGMKRSSVAKMLSGRRALWAQLWAGWCSCSQLVLMHIDCWYSYAGNLDKKVRTIT
jgi:hypothetical protein